MVDRDESRASKVLTAPRFCFEVDGIEIGVFRDFVEPDPSSGIDEFLTQAAPPARPWPHVLLRRGVTYRAPLLAWLNSARPELGGRPRRRASAAVTAVDASGNPLREWAITEVLPIHWKRADAAGGGEALEIAHRGVLPRIAAARSNTARRR